MANGRTLSRSSAAARCIYPQSDKCRRWSTTGTSTGSNGTGQRYELAPSRRCSPSAPGALEADSTSLWGGNPQEIVARHPLAKQIYA